MIDPAKVRRGLGLSQAQLARVLHCGRGHVRAMEAGRRAVTRPVALVLEALRDGWRPADYRKAVEPDQEQ